MKIIVLHPQNSCFQALYQSRQNSKYGVGTLEAAEKHLAMIISRTQETTELLNDVVLANKEQADGINGINTSVS